MSLSPIDEVVVQLNELDLSTSETSNCNYQHILEQICCDDFKRIECREHFLTPDLMTVLCDSLKSTNKTVIINGANLIAELGKYTTCRDFISDPTLVNLLIDNLRSLDLNILIQSCRALGNICFEKPDSQSLIISQGGLVEVLNLLDVCKVPNSIQNDPKLKAALIGLLLNLVSDNAPVHMQVYDRNILETFVQLLKQDLESNQGSVASQNIFIVLVALTESISVDMVFTEDICKMAVEMFRTSFQDEFCVTGLEFLEDAELPDSVKLNLAKAGLFQLFIQILEKKPNMLSVEETNKYDLTGRVLTNILTGDEAMEYLFDVNGGEILSHLTKWLSDEDKELVQVAVLCIGNIARTDRHSTEIVERNIHKSLMNILKDGSNNTKMQYAVMGTLRNLSIPRVNKLQLVKDGLMEVLLPLMDLDVKSSSAVIFKLVGTIRQIIDGQEALARELGCNEKMMNKLVTWSSSTIHPWVSSECCRCLCWLIKISKDKNVVRNVFRNGGYKHVMKLLGALHGLMQGEALSALTVTSRLLEWETESRDKDANERASSPVENVQKKEQKSAEEKELKFSDFERVLVDGDIGEKMTHLIMQHGVKMDENVLENIFTFLEIGIKSEKIREHFKEKNLKLVFHGTMESRDDYDKFRYRIEEIEKSL